MSSSVDGGPGPSAVSSSAYVEVQRSEKFQELRRRHRSIAFPLAIAFLAWYFLFVLLAGCTVAALRWLPPSAIAAAEAWAPATAP